MSEQARLTFEQCARLAGLLSAEQLAELADAVRARLGGQLPEDPRARGELLGEEAVTRGLLNAWQVKQLLEGCTKFTLGPYRIVDALGRGGGGQVFKGVHELLDREVAIKVLPRDRATPDRVERFLQEIRTLAMLDHPHLVRALDAGKDGGVYYLVLEYVPGLDLRRFVQASGPLTESEAATLIAQVAVGLDYAHRRGLVHRDVKPGNVLVTPDGHAKLSDLGFASSIFAEEVVQTRQAKIAGTIDYLAPDHIQAPWDPKPAWDIYSLGCTLYFAVTGRVPFPEGTTEEKLRAHLEKEPRDPQELNPRLSRQFVDVIRRMMAKDPQERLASAHEVVLRLGPWVDASRLPGEYAVVIYGQQQSKSIVAIHWLERQEALQAEKAAAEPTPGRSPAVNSGQIAAGEQMIIPPPVAEPSAAPVTSRLPAASPWDLLPDELPVSAAGSNTSSLGLIWSLFLFVVLPLVLILLAVVINRIL